MEKITIKANNFWDNDPRDQELTVVDGIVTDCKMIDKPVNDKWESLESSEEENVDGRV